VRGEEVVLEGGREYVKPVFTIGSSPLFFGLLSEEEVSEEMRRTKLGLFVDVPAGVVVEEPLQLCFYYGGFGDEQRLHNVVRVGKGSVVHIYSGCLSPRTVRGVHRSITEVYVGEGAVLTYTMVHHWGSGMKVFPITVVRVERGGTFVSDYISLREVGELRTSPRVEAMEGARVSLNSVVRSTGDSLYDLGGEVFLKGRGARGEVLSRAVVESGKVVARSRLVGDGEETVGHVECNGIIVGDGVLSSVPELEGRTSLTSLTHEASVGRIAREELNYLMARGFDEEEARELIIKGFLSFTSSDLPEVVRGFVERVVSESLKGEKGGE
jgi:Fe-S cluster assembly scaffold protein SufB